MLSLSTNGCQQGSYTNAKYGKLELFYDKTTKIDSFTTKHDFSRYT